MLVQEALDAALACNLEAAGDAVVRLRRESYDLAFAVHHQTQGYALHAACREAAAYLLPEDGGEFESHQAVQHAPCLLGVHQVHVQLARVVHRVQDGVFGDLVENNPAGFVLGDFKGVGEMPGYGFSLAVFIGSEPDGVGLVGQTLQVGHHPFLVVGHHVLRSKTVVQVYAEGLFLKIPDMSETGFYGEVFA